MWDFLGNIGSAAIGGITSLLGLNAQENMNEQNQEFQASENQKNRDWQSAEWQRQFDLTNAYNDPSAVVERLKKAGLNPAQIMAGGSSSAVGQSKALPSAPSGGTSASPSPDYSGIITSGFQSMQQIANSIKMLTEAKKTAKETPYIGALLDSQIKENLARFENEQAKADYQKLQTQFEQIFGSERRSKELSKLMSDTLLAEQEARLKGAQIELIDVEKLEKNMNALVAYAEKNKKEAEAARIKALIEPEIALLKAQASQATANAGLANAQALTENQLRPYRRAIEEAESQIKGDQSFISGSTWQYTIQMCEKAAYNAGLANDEKVKNILLKGKELDYRDGKEVRNWIKTFQGFIPMAPALPE